MESYGRLSRRLMPFVHFSAAVLLSPGAVILVDTSYEAYTRSSPTAGRSELHVWKPEYHNS